MAIPNINFSQVLDFLLHLFIIIIFDIVITGLYVWCANPEPSQSIAVIIIFPIYIVINIILLSIFYSITKNKIYFPLFIVNTIISCYILFVMFHAMMK